MLTLITCPTCHHKFSIPEGCMGQRSTCPNCQAIFVAGKSVSEGHAAEKGRLSPKMPLDKTMLADTEAPPIRYNCPRCKKPLEAAASEAGTKKPCPHCGGRLQVPAAPRPTATIDPALNKTMLGEAEGGAPQIPAGAVQRAPSPILPPAAIAPAPVAVASVAAAPQVAPATGWLVGSKRNYIIGGVLAALALLLVLYLVGRSNANAEYEKAMKAREDELAKLKKDIDEKTALMEKQQKLEEDYRRKWEDMMKDQQARQQRLDDQRALDQKNLEYLNDQKKAADAKAKLDADQKRLADEKAKAEADRARADAEAKRQLDDLRRQIDANKQQAVVIQQAPPVYYPPWYYGRPGWPWGW